MEFLKIGDKSLLYPIIQGGMGVGISLSSLAAHVAGNGGMGIISTAQIGFREDDFYKNPIEANLRAVKTELQKARDIAAEVFENRFKVSKQASKFLEKLKNYIESKNYKVSIIGYTDSKGTKQYNKELSLRRAESVEEKLIELGLAPEKIIETKGNGDLNPVASNDTEEGRAANRRIEVQFVN